MRIFVLGLVLLCATPAVAGATGAWIAELPVNEVGFTSSLRIRVYVQPNLVPVPPSVGQVVLVAADRGAGRDAFFIPSDLAFEVGSGLLYRAEFEQAGDLLGDALGGRLREGEEQLGFLVVPEQLGLADALAASPDSVVIRYAHHRASFRPAEPVEVEAWNAAFPAPGLAAALNAWWEWTRAVADAPPMDPGEKRLFAERIFPGQGHIVINEEISVEALRNAILRVGERAMHDTPSRQRVAPAYPSAARQLGAAGLVVALCYVDPNGTVQDATLLASNTVHMLNLAALSAAIDWRFATSLDAEGNLEDGWRLLPFQFKLVPSDSASAPPALAEAPESGDVPPRVIKNVDPGYPTEALKYRKAEGTVIYSVKVDQRGKLIGARLEQGVHPILDRAALTAIEQMYFAPATRDGVPVEGELTLPFTFTRPR